MDNVSLKYQLKDNRLVSKPKIIVIGSSTGGSKALEDLFSSLKGRRLEVPILVTQHIPENFTDSLVEQISSTTDLICVKAIDGMKVEAGKIYIAAGGSHMLVEEKLSDTQTKEVFIKLDFGAPVNFCRPAVDPMINSVSEIYKKYVLAIILTGMGSDGLNSCKIVAQEGGQVIAQDEETSVVWGMPGAVAKAGICGEVLPVPKIAQFLIQKTLGAIR
jgi:two-component system, chemotaxis family, protein-glutamate methylesterase/glutaminase